MNRKKLNTNKEYFRDRCDEVNVFDDAIKEDVQRVIEDLRDTLRANKNLVALSAPQIASKYRIFCMKFAGNDIRTFINPLIIERKGVKINQEQQIGFNEFDKTTYFTFRNMELTAGYQTPTGRVETNKFTGDACAVFEQMLQLLDGVFISDFGLEKLDGFDDLSEDEKKEIFLAYAQTLKEKGDRAEEELKNNKELAQLDKLTKFYTEYALGNVEIAELTEEEKEQIRNNIKTKEIHDDNAVVH